MWAVGWRFGFQRTGKRLAVLTALTRPGSTGTPPLVRIRTDTFLRREKCPRCRVRGCVSPGGRKRNDNAACGGDGPGEALYSKLPFPLPGRRREWGVLCGEAASLSAAARGVSDTLHSHRAACSLRGALRGGSAASGSAGIRRRAGQSGPERRPALPLSPLGLGAPPGRGEARFSPRSAHQSGHFSSSWKMSEMQRAVGRNRAEQLPQNSPPPPRQNKKRRLPPALERGGACRLSYSSSAPTRPFHSRK